MVAREDDYQQGFLGFYLREYFCGCHSSVLYCLWLQVCLIKNQFCEEMLEQSCET